jgi:hypothetical protein
MTVPSEMTWREVDRKVRQFWTDYDKLVAPRSSALEARLSELDSQAWEAIGAGLVEQAAPERVAEAIGELVLDISDRMFQARLTGPDAKRAQTGDD